MPSDERLQELLGRIQEDERLRGDLEDQAAKALVHWALAQTQQLAQIDTDDETLEAHAKAIRTAARTAARSGEQQPQQVLELAETSLKEVDPALVERLALRKELFGGGVQREQARFRAAATEAPAIAEADLLQAPAGPPVSHAVFTPVGSRVAAHIQRLARQLAALIATMERGEGRHA